MARNNSPAKRRARGTGAVFYSKALRCWVGRVPVGRKPGKGTLYRERRASTLEKLLPKLAALRPPGPETTVAEWAERWLKDIPVGAPTRDSYEIGIRNHIVPALGSMRLVDLTAFQIDLAAKQWSAGGLGAGTIRRLLSLLRNCLDGARRARLIPDNPATDVRRPRPPRSRIDPFTPDELVQVIEEAGQRPECRMFALLASAGCRVGEALALDVADYRDGMIAITRTYSPEHGLRRTKSENGIRTIRVPAIALPAIQPRTRSGPLFPGQRGGRRRNCAVWHSWARLMRRLGMKYRNVHQLRHSVATALISAGVPVGDVAKYLGTTIATLVKTYLHASGTNPADSMDRIFAAGSGQKKRA